MPPNSIRYARETVKLWRTYFAPLLVALSACTFHPKVHPEPPRDQPVVFNDDHSTQTLSLGIKELTRANLFFGTDVAKVAVRNQDLIKIKFEGENGFNSKLKAYYGGLHVVALRFEKNLPKGTPVLVVAEPINGNLSPLVIEAKVENPYIVTLSLPLGKTVEDLCNNQAYLVTVLLKTTAGLYWNARRALYPMSDCE